MSNTIMIRKCWLLFILLLAGFSVESKAQVYKSVIVPITISEVLDLNVNPTTTLTFNFTSTAQIDAGLTQLSPHNLTYKSNKAYYITIKGIGVTSNFSGGLAAAPMPISMLKYKLSTSSTWIPLSESPQALIGTLNSMSPRGTGTIMVNFRMDPGYVSHPAEDYSVTISYSIANQ